MSILLFKSACRLSDINTLSSLCAGSLEVHKILYELVSPVEHITAPFRIFLRKSI